MPSKLTVYLFASLKSQCLYHVEILNENKATLKDQRINFLYLALLET